MQREPEAIYSKTNNKEIIMQIENKWQDRLRDEWSNTTCLANCQNIEEINKTISDWWLSKIDTAIAEERDRIVGIIEKYKGEEIAMLLKELTGK